MFDGVVDVIFSVRVLFSVTFVFGVLISRYVVKMVFRLFSLSCKERVFWNDMGWWN